MSGTLKEDQNNANSVSTGEVQNTFLNTLLGGLHLAANFLEFRLHLFAFLLQVCHFFAKIDDSPRRLNGRLRGVFRSLVERSSRFPGPSNRNTIPRREIALGSPKETQGLHGRDSDPLHGMVEIGEGRSPWFLPSSRRLGDLS